MLRRASAHLLSLLVMGAVACALWPEARGLRCRFWNHVAQPEAHAPPAGARAGLLRVEHAGMRFARPRASGVDPNVRSLWQPEQLKEASIRWSGWIFVPQSGTWSFGTCSDDDSAVMIDDRLVAVNWGQHSPRTHWGRARLEKGWHRLRVDYVQIDGAGVAELLWKAPDGPVATVPPGFLARDRGPEPWLRDAWATLAGGTPEVLPHLERLAPWKRAAAPAGSPAYLPVRWMWADLWGGAHRDAVVAGGVGEPAPCAGLDAPGVLAGGWRVWRARVNVPWTSRVRVRFPHAAPLFLWMGGVPVVGEPGPERTGAGPQEVERTLPGGVNEILLATTPCTPYPPLELVAVAQPGLAAAPLVLAPPERPVWPEPPQAGAVADADRGAQPAHDPDAGARVARPVEHLCEELHERVWFWTDTRLQAPYLYRWDAKRFGHPAAIAPLLATWDGEVTVPRGGVWSFTVRASGRAWLELGGRTLYKDAGLAEAELRVELPPGPHAVRLHVHDPGVVRTVSLTWTPPGASEAVLVPPAALRPPAGVDAGTRPTAAAWGAAAAVALVLLLLAGGPGGYRGFVGRRWAWHAWVLLVALGLVVRLHDYAYVPSPGDTDDELTYHMVGTSLVQGGVPVGWAWMDAFPVSQVVPLHGRAFRVVAPMVAYPPLYSLIIGAVHHLAGATSAFEAKLHVTRLVPVLLSVLALALVAPLARRLGMRPVAGLLATAFLAVYPQAVIQNRLIKEENLLAPLLLLALYLVLAYRRRSGPGLRWAIVAVIVAAILTKPMGVAVAATAACGLAWRGHLRPAVLAGLSTILGVLLFAWYGCAYAGEAWLAQMRMFAGYAGRLDVMTPLAFSNTVTGTSAPTGWLVGLWIVSATTLLSLKPRRRRFLSLAVACYALVTAAVYPSQLNWGWYKIPLWPLFALGFGHQAWRLLRRADPLAALLFVGLFLLPTLEVLGGPVAGWPEAGQVSPFLGFLHGGTPGGWVSPRLLLRALLALLVCPALVLGALPRLPRRLVAGVLGAAILFAILGAMLVLAWHWGLVYPSPMPGDPWGYYENAP